MKGHAIIIFDIGNMSFHIVVQGDNYQSITLEH